MAFYTAIVRCCVVLHGHWTGVLTSPTSGSNERTLAVLGATGVRSAVLTPTGCGEAPVTVGEVRPVIVRCYDN